MNSEGPFPLPPTLKPSTLYFLLRPSLMVQNKILLKKESVSDLLGKEGRGDHREMTSLGPFLPLHPQVLVRMQSGLCGCWA